MSLITNIDDLRKVVKINRSIPFSTVFPYLNTASDIYITKYIGRSLLRRLSVEDLPEELKEIHRLVMTAEGILAMWIGNAELSIRISDSGFTVERNDKYVPASDTKIATIAESLCVRGFQHLDLALEYLSEHKDVFPEWEESLYFSKRDSSYIKSPKIYQDIGGVNIEYSLLRFDTMLPLMGQIERRYIAELFSPELYLELKTDIAPTESLKYDLQDLSRKFIANKSAALYTSETTKREGAISKNINYDPLLRPIYFNIPSAGNFYEEQAQFYYFELKKTYKAYQNSINGETVDEGLEWNNNDRRIFIDEG